MRAGSVKAAKETMLTGAAECAVCHSGNLISIAGDGMAG